MPNINTSVTLKQSTKTEAELQNDLNKAAALMGNVPTEEVFIPEAYKAAFGDPLTFSINTVEVEVPIGKKVTVPKPHADHVRRLMKGAVISKGQTRLTPEEVYED